MDSILRAGLIYLFLLLVMRIAGRRTLGEMTSFDFVLLLVIGEATQQALLGEDFSVMNAFVVIATLVFMDVVFALLKERSKILDRWLDGLPTVLVRDGRANEEILKKSRVDLSDVLESARKCHGILTLKQIRHAILERDGSISIIPRVPGGQPSMGGANGEEES